MSLLCVDHGGQRWRVQVLPSPPPTRLTRAQRRACSSAYYSLKNDRTSWFHLELLLYANFALSDLFVTLTYDVDHLPAGWRESKHNVPVFMRRLRAQRIARAAPCDYVYVHEALHGDQRPHHHLVLNRADAAEDLDALWGLGHVHIMTIEAFGGYQKLAKYITKEPREKGHPRPGERMWTPSKGLIRPEHYSVEVPDGYTVDLPPGVKPLAEGIEIEGSMPDLFGREILRYELVVPEKFNFTLSF